MIKYLIALFISFMRDHSNKKKAQDLRFKRLENYLDKCTTLDHLESFEKVLDKTLSKSDFRTVKYLTLMVRWANKEKDLCLTHVEMQNARIKEGDRILKMHGIC